MEISQNMSGFCFVNHKLLSCIQGSEMSSDDRSWLMRSVMSMDQAASVPYFYPRLFPVVCDTFFSSRTKGGF